jgi:hypothetical protein
MDGRMEIEKGRGRGEGEGERGRDRGLARLAAQERDLAEIVADAELAHQLLHQMVLKRTRSLTLNPKLVSP